MAFSTVTALVFLGFFELGVIVSQLFMLVFSDVSRVEVSVSELVVLIVVNASGFGFRLRVFEMRSKSEGPVGERPSDKED